MLYTLQTNKAYDTARALHSGQYRRDGCTHYIKHCSDVVKKVVDRYQYRWTPQQLERAVQIAWLHDTVEDERCTRKDLLDAGFEPEVVMGVCILARLPEETYLNFIRRCMLDEIVCGIKICDILANLGDTPSDSQITRYAQALLALTEHEREQNAERDRDKVAGTRNARPQGV